MLNTMKRLKNGEHVTILCIGDSITEQNYHCHGYLNYVGIVWEKLIQVYGRNAFVFNTGMSGNGIKRISTRLERDALAYKPDLITLMTGINDARDWKPDELDGFDALYMETVERIRQAGIELLLLTQNTINMNINNGAVNERKIYPVILERIRNLAAKHNLNLCDLHKIWEHEETTGIVYGWSLMADPLHPNEHGHRFFAYHLLKYLDPDFPECELPIKILR